MGLIREPDGVDFVIEPHVVTEDDHLNMLAFIAAYRERKAEELQQVSLRKPLFKRVAAML